MKGAKQTGPRSKPNGDVPPSENDDDVQRPSININEAVFIIVIIALMIVDMVLSQKTVNLFFGITSVAFQFLLIKILGPVLSIKEADSWLEIITPESFQF